MLSILVSCLRDKQGHQYIQVFQEVVQRHPLGVFQGYQRNVKDALCRDEQPCFARVLLQDRRRWMVDENTPHGLGVLLFSFNISSPRRCWCFAARTSRTRRGNCMDHEKWHFVVCIAYSTGALWSIWWVNPESRLRDEGRQRNFNLLENLGASAKRNNTTHPLQVAIIGSHQGGEVFCRAKGIGQFLVKFLKRITTPSFDVWPGTQSFSDSDRVVLEETQR